MIWTGVPEFLAMGGHGLYVWGSFGAAALAIFAELVTLRAREERSRGTVGEEGT